MAYRQGYRPTSANQPARSQRGYSSGARSAPTSSRGSGSKRTTKKRKKGRSLRIFLILVIIALLAVGAAMVYMMYNEVAEVEQLGTFYKGVHINGVPLYGATPTKAYDYLYNMAQTEMQGFEISLQYADASWKIDPDLLGMRDALDTAVKEAINEAYAIGRTNESFMERYQTIVDLQENPYHGYIASVDKNTSRIDGIISEIQAMVYQPPTDATMVFDPNRKGNAMVITPEVNGQELDAQSLKAQIIDMVNNMQGGNIQIQPTPIIPAVTAEKLASQVVLIGSFETQISSRSTEGRTANVALGCDKFNGKVFQPGEKISFNKIVGERTLKNGFHEAQEIVSGSYEMGVGGGICQVSSTLYNAVIKAGLRVRERTNHGIPVNYLEMGADATVSDGRHDFIFENNTDAPIYIVARVETSSKGSVCLFQIYGRPNPDGLTYKLRHETIETIPIPEPTKIPDKQMTYVTYLDEEEQVSDGAEGFKVQTYKVTMDSSGNVIEESLLYTDTYKEQAPKIYVGVNRRP